MCGENCLHLISTFNDWNILYVVKKPLCTNAMISLDWLYYFPDKLKQRFLKDFVTTRALAQPAVYFGMPTATIEACKLSEKGRWGFHMFFYQLFVLCLLVIPHTNGIVFWYQALTWKAVWKNICYRIGCLMKYTESWKLLIWFSEY